MGFSPLLHEPLTGVSERSRLAARFPARSGAALAAGTLGGGALLLVLYERLSATAPVTADSANAVLQGRAMAGGNLLLSGWTLSGASFYATDLPFYAVSAALRGLSPLVAHDVGAAIYALLVIAACFLARGRAVGSEAWWRVAVTFVLLVAPAPGQAAELLLLGPFHAGTTLVLLLALLVMDRAGEHPLGAAAVCVLLAFAVMSDALAVYVGLAPIAGVTMLRVLRSRDRRAADLRLLIAVAAALPLAMLLTALMGRLGGFATVPLNGSFAEIEDLPKNVGLAVKGALLLFGANFFGQPVASLATIGILIHLAGFGFVLATCRWIVQAWRRGEEPDLVVQVMLLAMVVDVTAYVFSNQAIDLMTSRYLIPFMAFGAVLAGRIGAARLEAGRLRWAAGGVALLYLVFAGLALLRTPPAPTPEAQLDAFLESHHLTYGVSAYWQASTMTVQSGGRVRVRAVQMGASQPGPYVWEAEVSWYDSSQPGNDARFLVRDTWDSRSITRSQAESAFGPPTEDYRVGQYEVLVWDHNLLQDFNH